jgi:hypothetical protein
MLPGVIVFGAGKDRNEHGEPVPFASTARLELPEHLNPAMYAGEAAISAIRCVMLLSCASARPGEKEFPIGWKRGLATRWREDCVLAVTLHFSLLDQVRAIRALRKSQNSTSPTKTVSFFSSRHGGLPSSSRIGSQALMDAPGRIGWLHDRNLVIFNPISTAS